MDLISQRVESRVRDDFDGETADLVLSHLAALDLPLVDNEGTRERVHAAIVLLAQGRYAAFTQSAALAETDWRDVLVAARLADQDWQERLDEQLGPGRPT